MKKIFTFLLSGLFFVAGPVLAVGRLTDASDKLNNAGRAAGTTGLSNVGIIIGQTINIGLGLIGLIFLILMVYAGYLWMTARGEEEKVKTAQKIITASMIGLVIVLGAYAITFLVMSRFSTQ